MPYGSLLNNTQIIMLGAFINNVLINLFKDQKYQIIYNNDWILPDEVQRFKLEDGSLEFWEGSDFICLIKSKTKKVEILLVKGLFEINTI